MDINYHYFAIKTLARFSEYPEDEAQYVASYSQLIDDFDLYNYMYLSDVPEFARQFATKVPFGWLFNPVTTGFNSWFDMARLILDKNQRQIVIPFHFVPREPLTAPQTTRGAWRTVPAQMTSPSLIQGLMKNAVRNYIASSGNRGDAMRLGMLLHTFADTYAHQGFSGFRGWENWALLDRAVDNIDGKDVTDSYSPEQYHNYPGIGHAEVNHAPDDSNIRFDMRQKLNESDNYSVFYNRSNTQEFAVVSREIVDILRSCKKMDPVDDKTWDSFVPSLARGFLTPQKEIGALCQHWSSIFPDYAYHYSKESLVNDCFALAEVDGRQKLLEPDLRSLFAENQEQISLHLLSVVDRSESEDFFRFNVIANEIREAVNGQSLRDEEFEIFAEEYRSKIAPTRH